jgi:hypothetical protein
MVSRIKAINALRPRLKRGKTVQTDELVDFVAGRTGLNAGEVLLVLMEAHDAVAFFNRSGRGVKLEGLGTYLPTIRLDGTLDVEHRLDWALRRALNVGRFLGEILNRKHIGKTPDELVAVWNVEHPDDPVK